MKFTRREMLKTGSLAALVCLPKSKLFSRLLTSAGKSYQTNGMVLWYRSPAKAWIEALALGNGRLGGMVFGGTANDQIGLNEDTLWSGGPYNPSQLVEKKRLFEIQQAIFSGNKKQAQTLANQLQGNSGKQASYQTVGDLFLSFPGHDTVSDYRRQLDLESATVNVSYRLGEVKYTREYFISPVDQVLIVRITADKPGMISFSARMNSPQAVVCSTSGTNTLIMKGKNGDLSNNGTVLVKSALTFQARLQIKSDGGEVSATAETVTVNAANSATVFLTAATSYKNYKDVSGDPELICRGYISRAVVKSYDKLKKDHSTEHQRLFSTVELDLGSSESVNLPTDERVHKFNKQSDPALIALYFQFGRYLLISSSRPGGQPANLQGIWNKDLMAPWGGKYTLNINTEMNYWPAHVTNLSVCEDALLAMVRDISQTGAVTASETYHARGWVCHHNTDLWRATAPIDTAYWGQWQTGGAWLCNQLYQRFAFEGNVEYLKEIYPIIKGSAEFFLDTLIEDPANGWLMVSPSNSPEHEYQKGLTISAGTTMDNQILRELFANCIQASEILGSDHSFRNDCSLKRSKLPPNHIGRAGQLQEWLDDADLEAPEIAHRHMSPLYGLFPGGEITPVRSKEFAAARKLTMMRDYLATQGMGWAVAWRINLWARLLDGEMAYQFLENIISWKTEINLFDKPSVQLDGNFGATAGIAEMLLQSHNSAIHLLPALPKKIDSGRITGLKARGGFTINEMLWRNGRVLRLVITSALGGNCRLRSPNVLSATFTTKTVSGTNPNPFYKAAFLAEPIMSPGVIADPVQIPITNIIDFETASGKTYILTGE